MEWVVALVAVPYCTSLINRILADDTLLSAIRQVLHQVLTLLSQILKCIQKVLVVVFYIGLVLSIFLSVFILFRFNELNLFLFRFVLLSIIIRISYESGCRSQVLANLGFSLILIHLSAPHSFLVATTSKIHLLFALWVSTTFHRFSFSFSLFEEVYCLLAVVLVILLIGVLILVATSSATASTSASVLILASIGSSSSLVSSTAATSTSLRILSTLRIG